MSNNNLSAVDVVLASAGTGKTTRLVKLIKEALQDGLQPHQVLATTFTNAAAEELRERTRSQLIASLMLSEATGLLGARMGTVHSVCGGLISEFSLEAGRSPNAEVLAEETALRVFSIAADAVIARLAPAVNPIARRAGLLDSWSAQARRIAELARQNGIDATQLADCADRSWAGLSGLLEQQVAGETSELLDQALQSSIDNVLKQLPGPGDETAKTAQGMDVLREAALRLARGYDLSWQDWVRLSKLDVGARSKQIVQPVIIAARAHGRHPRLHADLEALLRGIFRCASDALVSYQQVKKSQGWLDFTDQEQEALTLLRRPDVVRVLKERIGRVYIDEFQDTSPIQLAIFTELARIAQRSTWVGDPKQAIYGFRGTDPELMVIASQDVLKAGGGELTVLDKSFRSRPSLVDFINEVFVRAAGILGLPPEEIKIANKDRVEPANAPPSLAVWRVPGNKDEGWLGLAAALKRVLDAPDDWPVVPKGEQDARAIRPADIAILCGTNANARKIADALASQGIKASVGRSDLLGTLECRLLIAAMRWTADANDRLALVEMAHLLDTSGQQPAWFAEGLNGEQASLEALVPFSSHLRALRDNILHLTPREIVDAILGDAGVASAVYRWGHPLSRTENLEAVRALAVNYEDTCRQRRSPATLTGLLVWLDEQAESDRPPEQPASNDVDAIQILTYHRAKGLEWPMVVLADLDRQSVPDVFEPAVSTSGQAMDWTDPLAGRWVRYWPWPYGANQFRQKTKDTGLDTRAQRAPEWKDLNRRTFRESARLLYVGMTRARDYMVFALTGKRPTNWLNMLADDEGVPFIGMPGSTDSDILVGTDKRYSARVEEIAPPAELHAIQPPDAYGPEAAARATHPPFRILPSKIVHAESNATTYRKIDVGGRLALSGNVDMGSLGAAIHQFLAADVGPTDAADKRSQMAGEVLARWGITALGADELILASNRLHDHITKQWPGADILREVPVMGRQGLQRVSGRIDFLVNSDDGIAIIDHKSFPGTEKDWPARVQNYSSQLAAYADLTRRATGKSILGLYVYLPIAGTILDLRD
ncbi:DNA helicase UvrD [Pseudolabrys taiwanensis]|uniref:DNA 3'-5' helicase n=1 Tax=Pseudolabrys taiwanensis TaxID=331696 RepID=A0A345ZRJ4_9HYPH|nr:UvrD-helicase domain-containing protein [Pseudolabrys taiwanensis]AXK79541.1 DNA helicase UvrD [Pseudolabrys taiwanensis]